ncbi:MAG: TonB-dependent receptor [Bacteroidetes bacterium]|nr:TonB-dependent receptor [Bacteroidota bacterium]
MNIDSINPDNREEIVRNQKVLMRQNKYSAHLMYNYKIDSRNTVTSGVMVDVYDVKFIDSVLIQTGFYPRKYGTGYGALAQLYSMWKHKFSEQLSLNSGLHFQFFSISKSFAAEPRVSLKYQFTEKQSVSLGYGLHHQVQPLPTYYNYDLVAMDGKPTNLNMGFSRSQHLVLGYDWFFLKDFHIKAEAYFQYIDKVPIEQFRSSFSMLNAGADFGTPDNTYLVNKGKGRNYGLEITAEKFFSKGYYFLVTSSIFQSHYKASDNIWRNTAFNGKYVVNALGGYQILFGGKKNKVKRHTFAADAKITTAGGRYYTPIDLLASEAARAEVLLDKQAFSQKYKDYFRMDMKLSYRFSFKKMTHEFSTDFQNIFNIKNIFRKVYNPRTNTLNNEYQQGLFILPQYRMLF